MKRILLSAVFAVLFATVAHGWEIPTETLHYNIMYKWGLIHKKAGSVEIITNPNTGGGNFRSRLTGATAPWADRFFSVRDTLKGTIDKTTLFPGYYEKIAHEGGAFDRDVLVYSREGKNVSAKASLWRRRKKETEVRHYEEEHTATGLTLDMLSAFYYMRQLDFPNMKDGHETRLNVFSGSKKEILTIHYRGVEDVKVDKRSVPCYHITFTFTTEGGAISSDNMDAWISMTPQRIPLLLEGKLPVGKVRAVYSAP